MAEDVSGAASDTAPDSRLTSNTVGQKSDEADGDPRPTFDHLRQQSPVLDRALGLKAAVEAANGNDLHLLWARVQDLIRPLDAGARQKLFKQVEDRIASDAALLQRTREYFKPGVCWWTALELRQAINQLLGIPDEVVGIYDDARGLMARPESSNPFNPQLADLFLEPHLIAGLKTLLIYTLAAAEGRHNAGEIPLVHDLQLIYAVKIPDCLPMERVEGVTLLDRSGEQPQFLIPNAGFVLGGTFQDEKNHGLDCSAFVSHCTRCSNRFSTWVLEFCWRELANGIEDFSAEELTIRKEFLKDWGLAEALADYEAVKFEALDDLRPGDVIVRRWGGSNSKPPEGNSSLYLEPRSDGSVWSIECNRLHNPHSGERMDGVVYRAYDLFQPNVDVYILRRVE